MSADEKCRVHVWHGYRSYPCDRKVKRDGLCGLHAGAEARKATNAVKRDAKWQKERLEMDRLRTIAAEMSSGLGLRISSVGNDWLRIDIASAEDWMRRNGKPRGGAS